MMPQDVDEEPELGAFGAKLLHSKNAAVAQPPRLAVVECGGLLLWGLLVPKHTASLSERAL